MNKVEVIFNTYVELIEYFRSKKDSKEFLDFLSHLISHKDFLSVPKSYFQESTLIPIYENFSTLKNHSKLSQDEETELNKRIEIFLLFESYKQHNHFEKLQNLRELYNLEKLSKPEILYNQEFKSGTPQVKEEKKIHYLSCTIWHKP